MNVSVSVSTAIRTAYADQQGRDQIIINLVADHGLSLNAATKAYATIAKEEGWNSAPTSRKGEALAILQDRYPADSWDAAAVRDSVIELASELAVQESTARDYCRAYSDQLGIPHPVVDPRTAMFQWFAEHDGEEPEAMKIAFLEYAIEELGRSRSNANEYWKGYELHLYLSVGALS